MEAFYPVEVVSPPMVLVALLARADLHAAAGEVLQRRHDREHFINYIGIPDAHGAARLFGELLGSKHDRLQRRVFAFASLRRP